jgi:hypothetical protein
MTVFMILTVEGIAMIVIGFGYPSHAPVIRDSAPAVASIS